MAIYDYIAKNAAGEEFSGSMQGDNEAAVARALGEKKLFPVRIVPQQAARGGSSGGRVRLRDVGAMYGQLADLLKAGVPLVRSMETIAKSSANRALAAVVLKVRDDISQGRTFADALAMHPKVFPTLHSAMARAGERGGFLEDVLANLGEFLERQDELQSKVRGAMIYPAMLLCLGAAAMLFILILLVPQFKPMFKGISLPAPTVFLFALSDLIVQKWYISLIVALLAGMGIYGGIRSSAGRQLWGRWKLKIPIFGTAARMVSIARFCRIFGTMLANGVPMLQALDISKDAAGSITLAEAIDQAAANVQSGQPLNEPLKASGLFPAEIMEMIAVAEESNQLEKVLLQIAATVERRTNRQVDQAVRMVEPLILVFIAGIIGFIAVGLLYPIFTMAKTLK